MFFFFHFKELKMRFIYVLICFINTFLTSFLFIEILIFLFTKPLNKDFIFLNLFEGFFCFFIMAFFLSCFFTFFEICYSFFEFLKPGLKLNELNLSIFVFKIQILISLFCSFFIHFLFIPHLIQFLLSFEYKNVNSLFSFYYQAQLLDYIVIYWSLFLSFFCLFQLPFIIFLCLYFNLIKNDFLIKFRREFIIFFLFLACVLTPPDILSQIIVALPCICFYEFIIFVSIFSNEF